MPKKAKVKKIKLGKNESFTILIDSLDFSSLKFSNLLLTKNGEKEDVFIVNYYPERSWVASQISHFPSTFHGKIILNKINIEDYSLKSIDCMHVVIYGVIPCNGMPVGHEHIYQEDCDCGNGSPCDPPAWYVIDSDYVCFDPSDGGEEVFYESDPNGGYDTPVGGGSYNLPDGVDPDDVIITTEPILPYDNNNITALTIVNDLFGIELGPSADIDIDHLELFDPDSEIVIEGENIAYDNKGGFYFIDKG